jgi:hypothetical protein
MVVWTGAPEGMALIRGKDDAGQCVEDEDKEYNREDKRLPRVAFEQVLSLLRLFGFGLVHRLSSNGGSPRRARHRRLAFQSEDRIDESAHSTAAPTGMTTNKITSGRGDESRGKHVTKGDVPLVHLLFGWNRNY